MNEQGFKAIFFDMDGLLVDTESLFLIATRETFAPLGVEIPLDWYIHEGLEKGTSTYELVREKGITEEEFETLRRLRDERHTALLKNIQPIDGVLGTLQKLQGKVQMAIVTSSHHTHFDSIMEKTGMRHFFDFVITGEDVTRYKPDPEPYLKAWQLSGKEKEQCLVLEDSRRGVVAAKAAGLTCYAIPDALTKEHDFSIADKVLHSIRELPPLIGI
jgi:HAD superfamily hydrolase (TIGR01509 family)